MIVPVIIPYYRAPESLNKCKEYLFKQNSISIELYVHDNSTDNIYYTAAVNKGLKFFINENLYKYILIVTQDAFLDPQCLIEMCNVMNEHSDCGIVTPSSRDEDGFINWFGGLDAYPEGIHRIDSKGMDEKPFDTYWANGACMLLRSDMIREIGFMDKNMKFIYSDSDYSFTARCRGWKVKVAPKAIINHSLKTSGNETTLELSMIKLQDKLYFAEKWLTGDLYNKISFEGKNLNKYIIAESINNIKNTLGIS